MRLALPPLVSAEPAIQVPCGTLLPSGSLALSSGSDVLSLLPSQTDIDECSSSPCLVSERSWFNFSILI
jgi:hypothetical protein